MSNPSAVTGRRALVELVTAVRSLEPLHAAGVVLKATRRWPTPPGGLTTPRLLRLLSEHTGVPVEIGVPGGRFEPLAAAVLDGALAHPDLPGMSEAAASRALTDATPVRLADTIVTGEGLRLPGYSQGDDSRPTVVIVTACGMPVQLTADWSRELSGDRRVVTWETRTLFGEPVSRRRFDELAHGVAEQVADLMAVLDHYEVSSAHLMGMCGGAVIAAMAAAGHPDRIGSLSLWHGDFSGTVSTTTRHQGDLRALLNMAAAGRDDASAIQDSLLSTTLTTLPVDVAHLVIQPYLSKEAFYRYSVLTGATMNTDLGPWLPRIGQPCLVVTSTDDSTAHPAGSRQIADRIERARLHVADHGDHLSVFRPHRGLRSLLTDFLDRHHPVDGLQE
ncbi:pimeloyl-ACP methyl ester carboxylesterase [Stackebrandtia endophytica]|uniref:Pimeloyl-ACP methyl ester carboxylesterase n=1 Tax=Stackebrandtia endophytica TaxID=1496996 RepID=A0A543ARV4_9ACTN|nr:alpha/beta hydrolase [Stackebrandtia endophytica]TQL75312.1 pimeloyl-ACP methyl ester carboxylesterase [Stackebrandtia endophytica]